MYVKLATDRVYKKGDEGFALIHIEHDRWEITDTPNDALDGAEYKEQKPEKEPEPGKEQKPEKAKA